MENLSSAYVLINFNLYEKSYKGLEGSIKSSADVRVAELYPLSGKWDAIAKLESKNINSIAEYIVNVIRRTPGVLNTVTMAVDSGLEKKVTQSVQSKSSSDPQQARAQQSQ